MTKRASNWDNPSGKKSAKWRNVSLTKVRDAQFRVNDDESALRAIRRALLRDAEDLRSAISEVLTKSGIVISPDQMALGGYSCPESPTLHCIYNDTVDRFHDDCIFCHEPSERK